MGDVLSFPDGDCVEKGEAKSYQICMDCGEAFFFLINKSQVECATCGRLMENRQWKVRRNGER